MTPERKELIRFAEEWRNAEYEKIGGRYFTYDTRNDTAPVRAARVVKRKAKRVIDQHESKARKAYDRNKAAIDKRFNDLRRSCFLDPIDVVHRAIKSAVRKQR